MQPAPGFPTDTTNLPAFLRAGLLAPLHIGIRGRGQVRRKHAGMITIYSYVSQVCSPPAAPSLPPPDSGSDDSPCFSDSATACRLVEETLPPATAFALCFGGETAADGADGAADAAGAGGADGTAVARGAAARVAMRDLKAGDLVLSSPAKLARVIVNQHAKVRAAPASHRAATALQPHGHRPPTPCRRPAAAPRPRLYHQGCATVCVCT